MLCNSVESENASYISNDKISMFLLKGSIRLKEEDVANVKQFFCDIFAANILF